MTEHETRKLEKRVMSVETRIRLGEIEEENYQRTREKEIYGGQPTSFDEVENPIYEHY